MYLNGGVTIWTNIMKCTQSVSQDMTFSKVSPQKVFALELKLLAKANM